MASSPSCFLKKKGKLKLRQAPIEQGKWHQILHPRGVPRRAFHTFYPEPNVPNCKRAGRASFPHILWRTVAHANRGIPRCRHPEIPPFYDEPFLRGKATTFTIVPLGGRLPPLYEHFGFHC